VVDFFEEDGKRIIPEWAEEESYTWANEESNTIRNALNNKLEVFETGKDKKVLAVAEDEQILCEDLLLKLFSYRSGDRLQAREVVQHDWFKM